MEFEIAHPWKLGAPDPPVSAVLRPRPAQPVTAPAAGPGWRRQLHSPPAGRPCPATATGPFAGGCIWWRL